jgi:hypothetical protein
MDERIVSLKAIHDQAQAAEKAQPLRTGAALVQRRLKK